MAWSRKVRPQRVLIASSHALFGEGLRSLLSVRKKADVEVIGVVSNLQEALSALDQHSPDLVIVDYDDEALNRDEFLARFVEGEKKLRVVLLSLQGGEEALVYDRRTMAASAIDDWLEEWTHTNNVNEGITPPIDGAPNAEHRRGDMKHLIIAGILVIVVTALLIVGLGQVRLLPVEASAQAVPIDNLFSLEFKVIAFLFALIVVFMVYSIVVFRRKKGDLTDGPHMEGNMRLEVLWTVIPLITVLYFAYIGGQALAETQRIDPQAMEVNVIGSQWSWRFEYPQSGINSTDLILPVNKQILFHIRSTDVIHSFWVPEFRVKQDALPGGDQFVRDLRITPTKIGDYTVRCAELCGMQHAYMLAPVKVMAQNDFDAWVASQTAVSNDPVARGKQLAQQFGCVACHTADGSKGVGPTWKGVFGSQVTLSDGTTITANQAYLLESIRNPGAKVVEGFQNIMPPNIASGMSDQQVQDVIAYIESLK